MAKFRIVTDTIINTPESLLTIPSGKQVTVSCVEFSPFSTIRSACCRLNQRAKWTEFECSSPDNGATINIRRNVKPTHANV